MVMALLTTGKQFIRALETSGTLGVYVPLEGGHEGRYRRRLRAAGYDVLHITAKGLGDLSSYLTEVHGVRPPHLGKKDIRTYFVPPVARYRLEALRPHTKGLVVWLIEGHILSQQEIEYLITLPTIEPNIKVVVERGGDRTFRWTPLKDTLALA